MSSHQRAVKVLAALLISMTAAAVLLIVLGNNPPKAGPFCLASYYRLDPVEEAVHCGAVQHTTRWNRVEIYYSDTKVGNIEQLASLSGLADGEDINCHFCVCNGLGGRDGQIQTTQKWRRQWSIIPDQRWHGTSHTIRICVIADGKNTLPTDFQIKRTEALVEELCRRFDIQSEAVYYPIDWQ